MGADRVDRLDGLARAEQPDGPGHDGDGAEHVAGLGRQPDLGPHRDDALEGGVELHGHGARLHVLNVDVHAARQLEVARAELHLDLVGDGGVRAGRA